MTQSLKFFSLIVLGKTVKSLTNWIAAVIAATIVLPSASLANDVAFFYALDTDFQRLRSEGSAVPEPLKVGGRSIHVLSLEKHTIYAVKMGSGTVETAVSAQGLLSRFRCNVAFSLGPAGALSDNLDIGKWYRIASIVPYQKGSWTSSGFQIGKNDKNTLAVDTTASTTPKLFQNLKQITVASGEMFIASSSYREQLRQMANADAVDMNLFGLMTVCADHHVPLVNWRIISDRADDNASEDFRKFTQSYDGAGGKALAELIRNLPPNPNSPESYPELQKLLRKQ